MQDTIASPTACEASSGAGCSTVLRLPKSTIYNGCPLYATAFNIDGVFDIEIVIAARTRTDLYTALEKLNLTFDKRATARVRITSNVSVHPRAACGA